MPMSEGPLLFELDGAIAILTLNRTELANSIDFELVSVLVKAAIRCDTNPRHHRRRHLYGILTL
jgi:enoyl-CoA hydratase/carnithine racemase